MTRNIIVPKVNNNDTEVEVIEWHYTDGDLVEVGQLVAEVETSKARVSIEAEVTGYLETLSKVGEFVQCGAALGSIHESLDSILEEDSDRSEASEQSSLNSCSSENKHQSQEGAFSTTRFSQAALEYLDQENLDKSKFKGAGLVTRRMLESASSETDSSPRAPISIDRITTLPVKRTVPKKISKAKNIEIELLTAGQAGLINSSVTVRLHSEGIRETLRHSGEIGENVAALIVHEMSRLLTNYRELNAFYQGGSIHFYQTVDVGIALDLEKGLKVPVLRGADKLSLVDLSREMTAFGIRYLENELTPEDLTPGTVTVSDLSSEHVAHFQPLINHAQSFILGIGGESTQPGYPMSLTGVFDHRVTSGLTVSRFLNELRTRVLLYAQREWSGGD